MQSVDQKRIRDQIELINDSWRNQNYHQIGTCVSTDVIIAPPGTDTRVQGRDAYVQSYRDYDNAATTMEFNPAEPEIDILGDTAVAICPFTIVYRMNDKTYNEAGRDILVFTRSAGKWLVAWRTMLTSAAQ
jgi:hypothetical protein